MVKIKHLHNKKGWYYYVRSLDGQTKWLALETQDDQEALRRWAELEGDPEKFKNLVNGIGTVNKTTLQALQVLFREEIEGRLAPNSVRSYDRALKTILGAFGDLKIDQISRTRIIGLRDYMLSRPYEANLTIRVLSSLLQFAVDRGFLEANPAFFIKKHQENRHELTLTTEILFEKIFPVAEIQLKKAIMLAFHLAQHENEVKNMKWDNFELNSCKCTFIRQKTGTTITINYSRNEAFRSFLAAQEPVAGGYFIASPAGSPYSSFNRMWHKAIEAAQVNAFKFKEIRHLANSVLNAEGIPVYERMKMTGHKSISVNERYTHDQGMETVRAGEILGRFGNV